MASSYGVVFNKTDSAFTFMCPHCNLMVQVPESFIKCTIFRHAIDKSTGAFMDPHATRQVCDNWVATGQVWGCGRPFKFNGRSVEKCNYI